MERPWAVDGALAVRPVVSLSLAADHRASDGHPGGLLLAEIDRLAAGAGIPMIEAELRKTVLETLGDIAPEADLATLAPGKDLREELDIDSMDFLNFVVALHEKLGIDIPEPEYPRLVTLDGAVAYLSAKFAVA